MLHLLCGKISAGKSTLAARLAASPGTILVREDQWLAGLYPGEQATLDDYVRNSRRLRGVIGEINFDLLLKHRQPVRASRSYLKKINKEHAMILAAITQGDAKAARNALVAHLEESLNRYRSLLEEPASDALVAPREDRTDAQPPAATTPGAPGPND